MTEPYIGEVRATLAAGGNSRFLDCDGRLLSTTEYADLFAVIGYRYGGDGGAQFALPDLRGRTPVHRSSTIAVGQAGGRPVLEEGSTPTLGAITIGFPSGGPRPLVDAANVSNYQPSLGVRFQIAYRGVKP